MATDYDAPRNSTADLAEDSLDELVVRRDDTKSAVVDVDDASETFELPGGELLDEELAVAVVPMRVDEFRCSKCFLVHHRSQLVSERNGELICRECS
jgi:hypothetical protein